MLDISAFLNQTTAGDALALLKTMPSNSVDMCVTSPPYWGKRCYGNKKQIGLEKTPEAYIRRLTKIFIELKRVLKHTGTLWLNIGDTYWGGKGMSGSQSPESARIRNEKKLSITKEQHQLGGIGFKRPSDGKHKIIKPKDLVGVQWMLAFALRDKAGYYLRSDIIWNKSNAKPETVKDRCTVNHEYMFMFSKSRRYYYDNEAIKYPSVTEGYELANKRTVWTVATSSYKGPHFATFPEELIVDCIKAGCPEGGIVLDIFGGAGTTGLVCEKLNRNYILLELNPSNKVLSDNRIKSEIGFFKK